MPKFEMKYPNYKEGAYGVVFFSSDGIATKVFRRRLDAPESHVNSVFQSEVDAYLIASKNIDLCELIPNFFDTTNVCKIVDQNGSDISNKFYLHYAYMMEHVKGDFVKLGYHSENIRRSISERFCSAGILHTSDASITFKDGVVSKVIDFATKEFILEHQFPF